MSTSFPTSVWNGTARGGRASSLRKSRPNKFDWARMVEELRAMQRVCDGFGLGAAGVMATEEPAELNKLFVDDGVASDETQSLAAISSVSGTWTLTITLPGNDPVTTAAIAYDADATAIDSAIDTALDGLSVYGTAYANTHITVSGGPINADAVTLVFGGASVTHLNIPACTTVSVDLSDDTPPVVSTTQEGYTDSTLMLTSNSDPATFPNVWDRTTPSRSDVTVEREPDWDDWQTIVDQIAALEARVLPLALIEDVGVSPDDQLKANAWKRDGLSVALSVGGPNTVETWDGTSRTREVYTAARYAPDGWDWAEAYKRIRTLQRMLVPLGFDADGALPVIDPAVAGQLWIDSTSLYPVVSVSAGA